MEFKNYFEKIKKDTHQLNILLIQKQIEDNDIPEDVIKKVKNQIDRARLTDTVDDFIEEIRTSKILASYICISPGRQNISENLQLKFLKEKEVVIKNLGNNAVRFDGVECSMDYQSIKYPKRYFIAKVCNGSGGSQSAVVREIERSLSHVKNNHLNNEFYALLDGTRFDVDTMNTLREEFETDRIKILSVNNYTE